MRVRFTALMLVLFVPVGALIAQVAPAQPAHTDVPVKSVMLFSSGVGYFEHAGTVRGDGSTELRFKTTQINDILKSLVLQDLDGGKVTTITYPSQDPISKTLRSFQVDITSNPNMATLLNQLRGARVTVQFQAERVSGTILGVEYRQKAVDKGDALQIPTLNLLTGAVIRSVDLTMISSLTLDDPQLQDELTKALVALSQSRDQDKKPVTINFTGTGERRVRIGYVVETPIWKTSYRLMMDDKSARLQGWAIVENETESDWNNVALSLVSGRPISFIMDLYQPLYLQRPTVVPELFAGLRPQVYDAGTDAAKAQVPMNAPSPGAGGGRGGTLNSLSARAATAGETASFDFAGQSAMSSVRSMATTAQLGELFQYAIPNVTLARQKSAMLPIVTDTVGIERLSIYNASVLPRNPLNGVRLKNTTGKHLLQGPITVLDKNAYAGDARIDNVPPGQERLLSYGVDLELMVDNTKNSQTASVVTAKINKGALLLDRKSVSSQDYQVDNKGTRDKVILIEHPIRQGWKLAETQKPVETTPTLYRFQGNAIAGKVTVLTVKEEIVRQETISMLPADIGQLLVYSRTGEIPQPVRDAIAKAIQMKQGVLDIESQVTDRTDQVSAITQEQERIRENMKTVDQKSQYYERLLAKLNEQESTIEKLQKERDDLLVKRDAQRKALEDYLNGLTVGVIGVRLCLQVVAALLPVALAAQEATRDPDDLKDANGRITDSLAVAPSLRELRDGRVLLSSNRGGLLIADFTAGRAKQLPGVETGGRSSRLFALGGDSTLVLWAGGSIVLDGVTVMTVTPIKTRKPGVAPRLAGMDHRGFQLTLSDRGADDSATAVRIDPVTGVEDTVARLWRRPLIGRPFADMQEQAVPAPDGWIAVFRAEPYRVDWRTPAGKWIFGAPLVLPVLAMDKREKAVFADELRGFVPPGSEDNQYTFWPRNVELFSGSGLMTPTPDSSVLVLRRPIADARGSLYDVVDRRGKLVRELELNGNERIVGFGAASVYVFTTHGGVGGHLERHPWP